MGVCTMRFLSLEFSLAAIMALILYFAAAKSNPIFNTLLLIARVLFASGSKFAMDRRSIATSD